MISPERPIANVHITEAEEQQPSETEVDDALVILAEERVADLEEEWLPWDQVEPEIGPEEC